MKVSESEISADADPHQSLILLTSTLQFYFNQLIVGAHYVARGPDALMGLYFNPHS